MGGMRGGHEMAAARSARRGFGRRRTPVVRRRELVHDARLGAVGLRRDRPVDVAREAVLLDLARPELREAERDAAGDRLRAVELRVGPHRERVLAVLDVRRDARAKAGTRRVRRGEWRPERRRSGAELRAAPRRVQRTSQSSPCRRCVRRVVCASPCSELLSIAMRSVERDAERVGRPPPTVSESGECRSESIDAGVGDVDLAADARSRATTLHPRPRGGTMSRLGRSPSRRTASRPRRRRRSSRRARGGAAAARAALALGLPPPAAASYLLWVDGRGRVGETLSALPLVRALLARDAGAAALVTAGTPAALERLRLEGLDPARVVVQPRPVDSASAVRRFVRRWRPDALVLVEQELWPGMLLEARARACPSPSSTGASRSAPPAAGCRCRRCAPRCASCSLACASRSRRRRRWPPASAASARALSSTPAT